MKCNTYHATAALFAVALLCIGGGSRAQLVSSLTTSRLTGSLVDSSESFAGQFTLTNAAKVNSATLSLYDFNNIASISDLTAALYTDSANSPGSQIATSTGATGSLALSSSPITFTFDPQSLASGNYWLALTAANSTQIAWDGSSLAITNTGTDGLVDQMEAVSFSNHPYLTDTEELMFSIDAPLSESSTPEPGPMALLGGFGLAGLAAARRRRK